MRALAVLLFAVWPHTAQALELSADVQPRTATIGDHIAYRITARDGKNIPLPQRLENPEPFEILDTAATEENGMQTITFTLTTFKTGTLALPPYVVEWADAEGKPRRAETPRVLVEIVSVLKEGDKEPELKDTAHEAAARFEWREYVWPAAIVLAIIAAALIARRYLKKRKAPEPPPKEEIKLPPYRAALKKLEEIEREKLYEQGKIKEYFSGISDTMREYLFAEYGIDAPEQTTRELEQGWPPMLEGERKKFFAMLEISDAAKFAKIIPGAGDAMQTLNSAFEFLRDSPKVNSRPPEGPPAAG